MPKYVYECQTCEEEFEVCHEIGEDIVFCEECGGEVIKLMTFSNVLKKRKVGHVVDQAIEEARHDLQQAKKELKGKR